MTAHMHQTGSGDSLDCLVGLERLLFVPGPETLTTDLESSVIDETGVELKHMTHMLAKVDATAHS